MKIFVDADACPKPIKEILYRVANKRKIECILIANQILNHPFSEYIRSIRVDKGFDVADNQIVQQINPHDLVVTSDIPLADEVVKKSAVVITPKGQKYTQSNIGQALAMRNFYTDMRNAGLAQTKSKPFSNKQSQAFAAELDRYLAHKI